MSDDIPIVSKPLVHQLDEYLSPLVHWQTFGIHLPHITNSTIELIEHDHQDTKRRKIAMYATWLKLYPDATWDHVNDALIKAGEKELASVLHKTLPISSTSKQLEAVEKKIEVTVDEIAIQLVGLHKKFAKLVTNIRDTLDSAITGGQIAIKHISRYLEQHLDDEELILTNSKDIDDLFHKLHPYYSYLDCELLEEIVDQFLEDEIQEEVEKYVKEVEEFEELTTLQELKDAIEQALLPTQRVTPSTCEVILKVGRRWKNEKKRCLNKLLEHIFSKKRYLLNHIKLEDGSLCIRFLVPKSQVEMLIALATKHMEFMYLLGVFEMMINDIPVLMKYENENFTFDSALLESSQSGNNEAVQFLLLDLGVNINYSNSEGKTALMLASEAGHEEVVQILVSAEANVNLQDSAGQTALMLASGNIGIIHCLLLAKADLDIQRQDGNTALHIACYRGHNTVIELLLSYYASPAIKNTKKDTPFMASVRGNNSDILKLMIDAIQSSHLSSGIVLACRLGHSAVFSLLVKQLECTPQVIDLFISCAEGDVGSVIQHIIEFNIDPNTTLISGITPLMIASSCGHVEVIDTLIQMETDVNRIDSDNYSPLAYAITGNKSLPTVQYLLEAGANPHFHLDGITILERAYREEGQHDICDILFKFSAVDLQKRFTHLLDRVEEGVNALIGKKKNILLQVSHFLEVYPEITGSSKVHDSTDLFSRVRTYSDFLSYDMLVALTREFLQDEVNIQEELEDYLVMTKRFQNLLKIEHFQNVMGFLPQQEQTTKATNTYLIFKLNRLWGNKTLKYIRSLCSFLFSDNQRYLSHMTVDIVEEVPCIKFLIPNSTQIIEDLISEVTKNRELMYLLLGVFEMMINNTPVLMEDEIKNFTFDSALLESSQSGNNETIQFLLDLGVNTNYRNGEGKTALMLASEAGHKKALQTLVSAEADVNLQDSAGQTALMLANGNVGIIRCLLLANANLDIQRKDGNTALHIACYRGHNTLIELLLSYHASPVIKNTKDDTPFMASVRGNNADILMCMLDALPSSHLSSGIVIACRLGHSAVFSLLVKQLESAPQVIDLFTSCAEGDVGSVIQHIMEFNIDPNTTLISGITPLMIASSCGHVEVIDTLIQMEADVNRIDSDNYSPLAYAITGNKSLPTVQYLLEAGANPHVLLGGITILERAHREEGQQDICDILFKFSAVDLQKRFTHLLDRIEEGFNVLIGKAKHILLQVSQILEVYPEITGSSKVHDSTDLFSRVRAYSDFLSYELLVVITREFLKDNVEIQDEFEEYLSVVQTFEDLLKIEHFVNVMAFLPQEEQTTMATTTYLVFKLNRQWSNKTLNYIRSLCSFLFSDNLRYLSHMTVDIVEKVPCIKFLIPNSTQIIDDLISEVAKKRELMYLLLGVFEMMINNTPVLMEDEDKNFTFELALQKAVQFGNNEAVQLLLDLSNVDRIHDDSKPFPVASDPGHLSVDITSLLNKISINPNTLYDETGYPKLIRASGNGVYQMVEILLKKGADPNIHDNNGWTALLVACQNGHQQIVELLLKKQVDPNVQNSKNGRTALIQASVTGHYQVVEILLKKGADPDIHDNYGGTALIVASEMGHYQVVEILLKKGADPNINDNNGRTALIVASKNGHYQVVEILLKNGADSNIHNNNGFPALILASLNDHYQVVEILLKKGADPNIHDNDGFTALMFASYKRHYQVVEILLKNGADPNIHDNNGWTALMIASSNGHQQVVEILLEKQVDPNVQNSKNGRTALIQASLNGHYQVVEILLKKGADPNIYSNDGLTALIVASENGHQQVVELLEKQVDPNVQNSQNRIALFQASQEGHYQVVEILLKKGTDPNIHDNDGWTPLMVASFNGHQQVVELLLEKQVDPNVQNSKNGRTALIQACVTGHYQVVEILLKKGADPNIHDNSGLTALIVASHNGHYQVVEILLKKGADPNIHDNDEVTALMFASYKGHYQVVEILQKKGADRNIQEANDRMRALIIASENGHQQVVELLLEKQVDPNVQNRKTGETALIPASSNGHYQVVEILLKKGADPNIRSNDGWTALFFAAQNGHHQIVELLLKKQADPNVQDVKHGRTALIQASQEGHYQVVEMLLKKGADPNIHDNDGWTALIFAAQNGHQQIVEHLLEKQVDPNVQDSKYGRTALIQASQNGHYQVVKILLQKGADPNIHNSTGGTALLMASQQDHYQVVEMLLKKGADPNIHDNDGRTALIMASQQDHYQVVEMLLKNGADPNVHINNGRTALMFAILEGHSHIIELLLRYNANPHYFATIDEVSLDSFALAAGSGNIECVNILLKHTEFSLKSLSMGWYLACLFVHVPIITFLSNRLDIISDQRDLIISCLEGDLGSVVDQLMSGKITPDFEFIHGVTPLMISSSCGHTDIVEALITAGANVNKTDEFGCTPLDFAEAAQQYATKNILLQHNEIKSPGPESKSDTETTSEEQNLSTDTSQSTIKSSQDSLPIRKKELEPKKRPFLSIKKLFKDTVKYSKSIFSPHQRFDNREYSTTTRIPVF